MNRREFIAGVTASSLAEIPALAASADKAQSPSAVKTVYVVTKCHLDIGFTDTERNVLLLYFDDYFPHAMSLAEDLRRERGEERYVWTIAAWMLYEYLEQASAEQRNRAERAIAAGDIAWHAMPFTWQSEMLDRYLIATSLKFSQALDRRFGKKTIAGKLTDVPGHTRGLIAPLVEAGVEFLDIGDNPGCKAPDVPAMQSAGSRTSAEIEALNLALIPALVKTGLSAKQAQQVILEAPYEARPYLFNWRNPKGQQIAVLYHPLGYGSTVAIPGTDFAVSIRVRIDNSGPHSAGEVKAYYASLRQLFPGAKIVATDLSTVAAALQGVRSRLPVVTQEIGDTWIYGPASDPGKVARYRELCRLRLEWLAKKKLESGGAVDLAFTSRLILAPEHNWGLSTGHYLKHHDAYSPDQLSAARIVRPEFQKMDDEWVAKRRDMEIAVTTLPAPMRAEAHMRLDALVPVAPDIRDAKPLSPGAEIQARHFALALDPGSGAIMKLRDRKTGRDWASAAHPLACFRYQTFTSADFARFNAAYNTSKFAYNDFGKPGLDKYPVESSTCLAKIRSGSLEESAQGTRILTELHVASPNEAAAHLMSCPNRLALEIWLPNDDPAVFLNFQCFEKRANRLPEAMWLSFSPIAPNSQGWSLEKVDQPISPLDVIANGNRHLHAVTKNVNYRDDQGRFTLETLDAPLIAPGQRSLLDFNNRQPDMREGVHVNLYNNLWGTAFPQWYGQDMLFRFILRV